MMEGGACNSRQQGAKGAFLVYADSGHIERIKRDKGPEIFRDFQTDIQTFALQALRVSVEKTNIADNPFALDVRQSENQVIEQLLSGFKDAIAPAINSFEAGNGLIIDVQSLPVINDLSSRRMRRQPERDLALTRKAFDSLPATGH
jgi:hypothetical protein